MHCELAQTIEFLLTNMNKCKLMHLIYKKKTVMLIVSSCIYVLTNVVSCLVL